MRSGYLILCLLLNSMTLPVLADDDFVLVDKDDVAMNRAFKKAKKTLDDFLKKAANRPAGLSRFSAYIKVEDRGETEYLWVSDVKPHKDFYIGAVVSKPRLVTNVRYGATIGYWKSDIYDWQYYNEKTKRVVGAFTTCALLKRGKEEDDKYIRENGLDCTR